MDLVDTEKVSGELNLEKISDMATNNLVVPYPQSFEIPDAIKRNWNYERNAAGVYVPILEMKNPFIRISNGSQFNAVVRSKKRRKGLKSPNRHHRVHQFFLSPNYLSGQIAFTNSKSGVPVLRKGEVRKDMVYRFEIIEIGLRKSVFYCVPLAVNLSWMDFLKCNYKQAKDLKR